MHVCSIKCINSIKLTYNYSRVVCKHLLVATKCIYIYMYIFEGMGVNILPSSQLTKYNREK